MALVYDTATPALRALANRANNKAALHKVAAVAAAEMVRDNFAKMAQVERNKFGAAPRFWARMNRGTRAVSTQVEGAVAMPREVAQRYYGGPIRPTGGRKYLAIPANRTAYRRSPRSFQDLFFAVFGGKPVLARASKSHTEVMYWLVRGVTQRGNPRVLPPQDVLGRHVERVVSDYLVSETPGTGAKS